MRKRQLTKMIVVTSETYNRIIQDTKHFQKTIGGGKWSNCDTIKEYHKILDSLGGKKA